METNIRSSPEPIIDQEGTITSMQSKSNSYHKKRTADTKIRFAIYILGSLLLVGGCFCWEIPGSIESGVEKHFGISPD